MTGMRVFEIANERGMDTNSVLAVLRTLGEEVSGPTSRLTPPVERRLREALGPHASPAVPTVPAAPRSTPRPRPATPPGADSSRSFSRARSQGAPPRPLPRQGALRGEHDTAVRNLIPTLYSILLDSGISAPASPIVIFHDREAAKPYGVRTLESEAWDPGEQLDLRAVLAPLRELDRQYRQHHWTPPNVFIVINLDARRAWHARSMGSAKNQLHHTHLDAMTLVELQPRGEGLPPRLSRHAQMFSPTDAATLSAELGTANDRPEEVFLLSEDLLRLTVDSLDGAELLDPPPVHVNALWVFARPVVMQRPDQSDRHVRAIWFRQGQAVWRIRTFAVGKPMHIKEVGEPLAGRIPFVPRWDESRPEQQVVAAVWALMSQGGVTETEDPTELRIPEYGPRPPRPEDVHVVRVKAGTDHARVYGADNPENLLRPAWSVRGHWRRQPYRSFGVDEDGTVRTKLIWIASYTKGDPTSLPPGNKVIAVSA
jgi:hypothetical protein